MYKQVDRLEKQTMNVLLNQNNWLTEAPAAGINSSVYNSIENYKHILSTYTCTSKCIKYLYIVPGPSNKATFPTITEHIRQTDTSDDVYY